jgi:hypothetical protein
MNNHSAYVAIDESRKSYSKGLPHCVALVAMYLRRAPGLLLVGWVVRPLLHTWQLPRACLRVVALLLPPADQAPGPASLQTVSPWLAVMPHVPAGQSAIGNSRVAARV